MSRRRRGNKSLVKQATDRFNKMKAFGESKRSDKMVGKTQDKIYSYKTMQTYLDNSIRTLKSIKEKHPEVKTIDDAEKYIPEEIEQWIKDGKSAWTINTYIMSINKLYQVRNDHWGVELPRRNIKDIKRSRECSERPRFSEEKNRDLVNFCRCTGLRRRELQQIKGSDFKYDNNKESYYFSVKNGKGGRPRNAYIIATDKELKDIIKRSNRAADGLIWGNVTAHMDVHKYRAEYARRLYDKHSRPLETLSYKDKYFARGVLKGCVYDKQALLVVSEDLGHSRLNVVVQHYLN